MAMTSLETVIWKAGLHFIAVHSAALADRDAAYAWAQKSIAQPHLHAIGVNFKTLEIASGEARSS